MSSDLHIEELAEVLRGVTPSKTTGEPGGALFFGLHEISEGGTAQRFVEPTADLGRAVRLREGDVVVALLGNIGDAAVVSAEASGAVLGRECAAIRIREGEDRVVPQWIRIVLQSKPFRDRAQALATGTTMPRLSCKALSEVIIPIPTSNEVRHFVERIEALETAIEGQRELAGALTALRDAEIELIVSGTVSDNLAHTRAAVATFGGDSIDG